jgi:hypothetical protein
VQLVNWVLSFSNKKGTGHKKHGVLVLLIATLKLKVSTILIVTSHGTWMLM